MLTLENGVENISNSRAIHDLTSLQRIENGGNSTPFISPGLLSSPTRLHKSWLMFDYLMVVQF